MLKSGCPNETPVSKNLVRPLFLLLPKKTFRPIGRTFTRKKISGFLNNPKNQIEILLDGKKIKKLQIKDLNQEQLLFPLYNLFKTEIIKEYRPGIYIEQKAIGFIASYEIKLERFNIDHLQFNLVQFSDKQLLQKPTYQNKKVVFRKKEIFLIYQNGFETLK